MFGVEDFARHCRVPDRVLRHYDSVGLRARLDIIDMEGAMPTDEVVIKEIPAAWVAELSGTAAIARAATLVHRGDMSGVMSTKQTLARWIDTSGFRSAGYNRELSIAAGDNPDYWVAELQEPLVLANSGG